MSVSLRAGLRDLLGLVSLACGTGIGCGGLTSMPGAGDAGDPDKLVWDSDACADPCGVLLRLCGPSTSWDIPLLVYDCCEQQLRVLLLLLSSRVSAGFKLTTTFSTTYSDTAQLPKHSSW